jgi:outer membrane biogenesis lipoprotein LolB
MRILVLALAALSLAACDMGRPTSKTAAPTTVQPWQYCCVERTTGSKDYQPWAECAYCCGEMHANMCVEGYPPGSDGRRR